LASKEKGQMDRNSVVLIASIVLAGCGSDADTDDPATGDAAAQDSPAEAVHETGGGGDAASDVLPDAPDAPDAQPVDAGPGPFDLRVNFVGTEQFQGKMLHYILVEDVGGVQRPEDALQLHGGTAWFQTYKTLELGGTYSLHYHIDIDGDHACHAAPTDVVGRASIGPVFDDVVLAVDLQQPATGDCSALSSESGPFDLYLFLTGFTGEESPHAVYLTLDPYGFVETFAADQMLFFSNRLPPGAPVEIRVFVDLDDDGECDLPPTDHVWSAEVTAVDDDVWFDFPLESPYDATACFTPM
jgi:hypothetical protein